MAKKKKKKKSGGDGPKPLISKKLKKKIIRLFILGSIAGGGYALYDPTIIQDEATRDKVEGLKAEVIEVSTTAQEQLASRLPEDFQLSSLTKILPRGAVLGEEEVQVEGILGEITEKIKQLPQDKLQQIKADICSDVLLKATASASQ